MKNVTLFSLIALMCMSGATIDKDKESADTRTTYYPILQKKDRTDTVKSILEPVIDKDRVSSILAGSASPETVKSILEAANGGSIDSRYLHELIEKESTALAILRDERTKLCPNTLFAKVFGSKTQECQNHELAIAHYETFILGLKNKIQLIDMIERKLIPKP